MGIKERELALFKEEVRLLCLYGAEVQHFADLANKGGEIDKNKLCYAISMVKDYSAFVQSTEKRIGIDMGLSFMEDNEFLGFSIKQGRLITEDRTLVLETCKKWIYGFPEEANAYQYAVGMYAIALAYSDIVDDGVKYPDYVKGIDERRTA